MATSKIEKIRQKLLVCQGEKEPILKIVIKSSKGFYDTLRIKEESLTII